MDCRYFSEHL